MTAFNRDKTFFIGQCVNLCEATLIIIINWKKSIVKLVDIKSSMRTPWPYYVRKWEKEWNLEPNCFHTQIMLPQVENKIFIAMGNLKRHIVKWYLECLTGFCHLRKHRNTMGEEIDMCRYECKRRKLLIT